VTGEEPQIGAIGGHPAGARARWGAESVFLLVATVAVLIARIPVLAVRFFDQDELEHAHAAWSVFRGLLPYRDFFEHHTPWYYYVLAPFFRWFAVDQSFASASHFLSFARGLSLALTALSAVLVYRIARIGADRRVGLLAALFLVGLPVVIQKTLEIRPDVPALPFFLAGLWFLLRGLDARHGSSPPGLRWFLGGGLCLGASIMCTQKALFILPGAFAGLGVWALAGGRAALRGRILAVLIVLVGVALPFVATWVAFALQGAGPQFIQNNFLLNAKWRMHSGRHIQKVLATSWPVVALALVGAAAAMARFRRGRQRQYGDVLLLCTLGGLIAGLLIVPAAYRQYYLMPLPIVCVFGAQGLGVLIDRARERSRAWLVVGAAAVFLVWPAVDLVASFSRRDERQIARLRYVFEHTAPTDTVLDGWMGTAVFRPHPGHYFFMHGELRVMLTESEKEAYVDALEKAPPAFIALDDELVAIGPRFMRFVRGNYVSDDGLFYRLR
jgi:4-amino-4-deoxy-L-arabinose transferase-like glycosyltransferase